LVIRSSSSRDVQRLVASLDSPSALEREAAVARLIVIGERAVERLLAVLKNSSSTTSSVAALAVLEAIGDPRGLEAILTATGSDSIAVAAIQAARSYLKGRSGSRALDRLTAISLDLGRPDGVRLAAFLALEGLGPATIKPLVAQLRDDPSAAMRTAVSSGGAAKADPAAVLADAAEIGLPQTPAELREAIAAAGAGAPLAALLRIVERARDREAAEPPSRRTHWTMVRAAAHVALANRQSRLALYDLRESIESAAGPLPVEFLAALSSVGDASCLEPIAVAYGRTAAAAQDDWWRRHLEAAFRTIVTRNKITRRHTVLKKIEKRYGTALTRV
jgi:hypothetical protein